MLKQMSHEIAADENDPLLSFVQNDGSDSGDADAENHGIVDSAPHVAEVSGNHIKVFKRRWYVLSLFSLVNVMQSMLWNTWGPLAQSAKIAFGWSLDEIALLTNWGCIMFVASMAFFSWLMDVKGIICYVFWCTSLQIIVCD